MFLLRLGQGANTSVFQRMAINHTMKLNFEFANKQNPQEEWIKFSDFMSSEMMKQLKTSQDQVSWEELKRKVIIKKLNEENGDLITVIIEYVDCKVYE